MVDTTKRNAVVERFFAEHYGSGYTPDPEATPLGVLDAIDDMADRIVELEATVERQDRILAALREPSEAMMLVATNEHYRSSTQKIGSPIRSAIRAAVAAAEQEVDRR